MDTQLYLAFVAATVVLALIPGPNVAVIVANSVAYGARFGLLTVGGTSTAILIQLGLTGLGMSAALGALCQRVGAPSIDAVDAWGIATDARIC